MGAVGSGGFVLCIRLSQVGLGVKLLVIALGYGFNPRVEQYRCHLWGALWGYFWTMDALYDSLGFLVAE